MFLHLVPNVWLRPTDQRDEADNARALLTIPDSDHLTLLNVYDLWVKSACILPIPRLLTQNCLSVRFEGSQLVLEPLCIPEFSTGGRESSMSTGVTNGSTQHRAHISWNSFNTLSTGP